MQTSIKQCSHEEIARLDDLLLEYRNTLDYQNIFSSKEWLLSFLAVYKPKINFIIQSNNRLNYFLVSVFNDEVVFTGDPFNDFNSVFIKAEDDFYNFAEIVKYFSALGYKVKLDNLFEPQLLELLSNIGTVQDGVTCMKTVISENGQNYVALISKRIKQMYEKFSSELSFDRIFSNNEKFSPILADLLKMRQDKLLSHKKKECNLSFKDKFNEFITKLSGFDSLKENLFIDYCRSKDDGGIMALSLIFAKDKGAICYLRAHVKLNNQISYGLILDYWSNRKNINEGVEVMDFTRGDESYKYRLGAKEYKLKNFVTI